MCGLVSVFCSDPTNEIDCGLARTAVEAELRDALDVLKHRGPDSSGIWVSPDARVGLGHVRLSIIDLATGQQPLADEDNTIHCVVTGEIYDYERIRGELVTEGYRFKTKSDSELVVQLQVAPLRIGLSLTSVLRYKRYGMNLLSHLRGEFAFVLYDSIRRLQIVARDRFGVKPLYYTTVNGRTMFASEIKAFLGLGWKAEWDIDAIVNAAEFGDERTVFKGVHKLAPGQQAICRASGALELQSYWDLKFPPSSNSCADSLEHMVDTVRNTIVESVRLRLRSDVPLAVYLSGGIDSSAVAGIATHLLRQQDRRARVTAFTLAYTEDPSRDESPLATHTAEYLNADLHTVQATETALVSVLEDTIWHSEQPNTTLHGAGRHLLARAVRDAGFKVVLSGEGSDEIFGGYPFLVNDYLLEEDRAAAALGIPLPEAADRLLLSGSTTAQGSLLRTTSHLATLKFLATDREIYTTQSLQRAGGSDPLRCMEEGIQPTARDDRRQHSFHTSMYTISKTLLSRMILNTSGDRADMAYAVESRVPFLDHYLVDYVSQNIPPSLKLRPIYDSEQRKWSLSEKWILRQAVRPFISDAVYHRQKIAFNPPLAASDSPRTRLLPLQAHLRARLTEAAVRRVGFFDWDFVREQLDGYVESAGGLDTRAKICLHVLSFVVLQEKFSVPTWR
ncbi:unnamed protein product [Mycena citricolor]|uniref:Glutamine amidotransferase type-2 domain-containing protein n=1 Tax=Mycena citricolor TaxID=2018698 RepID=A0AAD2HUT9_9AGAR|nr:unnamed protein product [Mycena citricolor]